MANTIKYDTFLDLLDKEGYESAMNYKNSFVPSKIYKFMKLPEQKEELSQRVDQITHGMIWMSKKKGLNDPFEFLMIDIDELSPEEKQYYNKVVDALEITCFSKTVNNQAMWGYYALGKYGLCIEYNVENKDSLYPVEYINKRRSYSKIYREFLAKKEDLAREVLSIKFPKNAHGRTSVILTTLQTMYCYKDASWKHEQEIRYISKMESSELDKIIENDISESDGNGSLHNLADCGLSINKIYFTNFFSSNIKNLCGYICKCLNLKQYYEFCRTVSGVSYEEYQKAIRSSEFANGHNEILCNEVNFGK